ncbi:sodium/proton antiporter (NhaA family) [Albidovulum inexpectatum]|uniref:Na(+)/H(+) antiporter NhaA n=1 Tax=Albidovulum inexpectatum TaxID=196587 RepID=A0A2S5JL34_9RHOB|nr:Na+/H+ antiporter NhaA [Albidovulum inexpectatum]PPB82111.1 sodium/proton antiporter (NhaA family) [Albidovulum inexpectatum]
MYRVWNFATSHSLLLILGAAIALAWANIDQTGYQDFVNLVIADHFFIGHPGEEGGQAERTLTLDFLVNDLLMSLFFAVAAKEVWEAVILKNGALRGRKALTPLIATAGGMSVPVAIYLCLAATLGIFDTVSRGWAIPTATDIAFSYFVGRLVFGARHPAIRFLLLLAIADDAGGLFILAIFYPGDDLTPAWLLLSLGAAAATFVLFNWLPRHMDRGDPLRRWQTWVARKLDFWPYLVAGCVSWFGFQQAGVHPALGLLPIIPAIPHADRAFGYFAEAERYLTDPLNRIAHRLKTPVQIILFFFGLLNAGVQLAAFSEPTWLVLCALMIGKPLGIFLFGWFAAELLRFGLPKGMRLADLAVLGCVASIGFTVALFVATVAFPAGPVQDAAKMGALLSLSSGLVAILAGRAFHVEHAGN